MYSDEYAASMSDIPRRFESGTAWASNGTKKSFLSANANQTA